MQRQASVANFIGGTTKQLDWLTNGRSRHFASPPAIACSISSEAFTLRGLTQLVPTCLVVAADAGVAGVEIHLERVGQVARHHRALEEMDVLERVDHAADVVEVLDLSSAR